MFFYNNQNTYTPDIDWYNRAFRYGDAFFETMLFKGDGIRFWPLHYDRIIKTLGILQMEPPEDLTYKKLGNEIFRLVQEAILSPAKIRVTFWRYGYGTYTPQENSISYIIEAAQIDPRYLDLNTKGHVLDIYRDTYKNTDVLANLKTIGCLTYTLASLFVKKHGLDDAIMLNHHGRVAECTSSNIFLAMGKEIITPPLSEGCLDGVMRRHLLETLPQKGYTVKEQPIEIADLEKADEIFTTNALGIKWVEKINGIEKTFGDNVSSRIFRNL